MPLSLALSSRIRALRVRMHSGDASSTRTRSRPALATFCADNGACCSFLLARRNQEDFDGSTLALLTGTFACSRSCSGFCSVSCGRRLSSPSFSSPISPASSSSLIRRVLPHSIASARKSPSSALSPCSTRKFFNPKAVDAREPTGTVTITRVDGSARQGSAES